MSGSGGDTVLKILLDSNPDLRSQNSYKNLLDNNRTSINLDFVNSFAYSQISKMSMKDYCDTDIELLKTQLDTLSNNNPTIPWLLKTHLYYNYSQEVVDITVGDSLLPFMLKAGLHKNPRGSNRMQENYHPMISKISNPDVLYKFDCYNIVVTAISNRQYINFQIPLECILDSWEKFTHSLSQTQLNVSQNCYNYYQNWITSNKQFYPSKQYVSLVDDKNYDFNCNELSIEERYCLLALAGKKFCLLS